MAAGKKKRSNRKTKAGQQPAISSGRLSGKVAVVTGGSRGIGLAIARALVGEGCDVVIAGRDPSALSKATEELESVAANLDPHPTILAKRCEVRKLDSVNALFALVKKRWGRLDILVNNAGISQAMVSTEDISIELWKSVIDTNLTGLFLCSRGAVPLMPRGSTIVNNLSLAARLTFPKFAAYNASKHGALGFTLTLREELIPKGIRVMALMPGATATDIWDQFWPEAPRKKMVDPKSVAQAVLYAVLLPPNANLSELMLVPMQGVL